MAVEAERRGFLVQGASPAGVRRQGRTPDWSGDSNGHIRITAQGVEVTLRVREDGVQGRAIYPRNDYRYREREVPVRRSFTFEEGAKGTVRISVIAPHSRSSRVSSWGDGKTQTLEECLPAVLMEVEALAAEQRERINLEQQEAERQRVAWEDAKLEARRRHAERLRAEILDEQVRAWQRTTAIRSYCDAIEQDRPHDERAAEWVAWARRFAATIDPLASPLAVPEPPETVRSGDLEPFLDGWSAHVPERSTPWR